MPFQRPGHAPGDGFARLGGRRYARYRQFERGPGRGVERRHKPMCEFAGSPRSHAAAPTSRGDAGISERARDRASEPRRSIGTNDPRATGRRYRPCQPTLGRQRGPFRIIRCRLPPGAPSRSRPDRTSTSRCHTDRRAHRRDLPRERRAAASTGVAAPQPSRRPFLRRRHHPSAARIIPRPMHPSSRASTCGGGARDRPPHRGPLSGASAVRIPARRPRRARLARCRPRSGARWSDPWRSPPRRSRPPPS